jgi:hypothetical protein
MILKINPKKNIYGKYFLATEAPDDEETEVTEEQPKPRRNVKVISVKPSNRRKDFTQVGNDPITPDTADLDDSVDIDETDYSVEDSETTTDQPETDTPQATDEEPTADDEQTETLAQPTGEDSVDFTADSDASDETGEDGPDTDGDEDFATDNNADNQTPEKPSNAPQSETMNRPGVELDSTRKYNLYKEFMSLFNACDNYISKLENMLRNDYEENQILRISVNNLREIKDILNDYMSIRFQLNTYVQSLLFYQKMVVAVQLVFKLLKSITSS